MLHQNAALVMICRADGALTAVLHDEFGFGLAPGGVFGGMLAASDSPRAAQFLQVAASGQPPVDWELCASCPQGLAPLYFTGLWIAAGILIVAAAHPLFGRAAQTVLEKAAHDLRNPVSGILAASEYLSEELGDSLEEHQSSILGLIQSSSRLILQRLGTMEPPSGAPGPIRSDGTG